MILWNIKIALSILLMNSKFLYIKFVILKIILYLVFKILIQLRVIGKLHLELSKVSL